MINYSNRDQSYEYIPLQTEMGGEKDSQTNNSISLYKPNSIIHESREFNEHNMSKYSDRALGNSNLQLESIASLHSFRVSRSIADMKDNERTLLENMNKIQTNETNRVLQTPIKSKPNKIYIDNVFDCSNNESKSIMISELDIQITNPNENITVNTNTNPNVNNAKGNTSSTHNDNTYTVSNINTHYLTNIKPTQTTIKTIEKKKLERVNTMKCQKTAKMYNELTYMTETVFQTPKINKRPHNKVTDKYSTKHDNQRKYNRAYSYKDTSLKNNKALSKSICDSEKRIIDKRQQTSLSMKKLTNQISIFDLLYKLNMQRASSLNKVQQTKACNILMTPNVNSKAYYTGQSNYSTASHETLKKNCNNKIPKTQLKMAKQKVENCIVEVERKEYNHNPKQFCSLKFNTPNKLSKGGIANIQRDFSLNDKTKNRDQVYTSFKTTEISNSRSISKTQQTHNNINTNSTNQLKPFCDNHLNIFHTHQSLLNDKAKYSALSSNKTKQYYTKHYFDTKSNAQSIEKNIDHSSISFRNIKKTNVKTKAKNNMKTQTGQKTQHKTKNVNIKEFSKMKKTTNDKRKQVQNEIAKNGKQNVQMYKNNIKHITITPINGLKMKMMQLQQQKEKRELQSKQHEVISSTTSKDIKIQNNEAFFKRLQNKH